jgi:hypothetical protein
MLRQTWNSSTRPYLIGRYYASHKSNVSTARSLFDVVVDIQVEIIEFFLQLLLVFAESTQIVHLQPATISMHAREKIRCKSMAK